MANESTPTGSSPVQRMVSLRAPSHDELRLRMGELSHREAVIAKAAFALAMADDRVMGLVRAASEVANDLEAELKARYGNGVLDYPCMRQDYKAEMQAVNELRAALAPFEQANA